MLNSLALLQPRCIVLHGRLPLPRMWAPKPSSLVWSCLVVTYPSTQLRNLSDLSSKCCLFTPKINGAAKKEDYLHQIFSHLVELISFQHSSPNDGFSRRLSSAMAIHVERPAAGAKYRDQLHELYSTVMSDIPLYVLIEADGTVGLSYHTDSYQRTDIASLGESFCNAFVALLKPHSTISMCLERIMPEQQRRRLQEIGLHLRPLHFPGRQTLSLFSKKS